MIYPGATIALARKFTSKSDPVATATITCELRSPAGQTYPVTMAPATIATLSASSSGTFVIPKTQQSAGVWHARYECTGDIDAVAEVPFVVQPSHVLTS